MWVLGPVWEVVGPAWAANWYAVKARASRRMRRARWHERGPGERTARLFLSVMRAGDGDQLPSFTATGGTGFGVHDPMRAHTVRDSSALGAAPKGAAGTVGMNLTTWIRR